MTSEPQQTSAAEPQAGQPADSRLQHLTLGLLMVIIVALAGLWIVERGHARRARNNLLEMQQAVEQQNEQVRTVLGLTPPPTIDRDALPSRQGRLDGEQRKILRMPADRARLLGLREGDIIEVAPETPPGGGQ